MAGSAAPGSNASEHDHAPGPAQLALDRARARFAVVLRVGSTVVGSVVAVAGTTVPEPILLTVVIIALALWSGIFAMVALREGLRGPLVVVDAMVVAVICAMSGQLLPVDLPAGADGSDWVAMVASTGVYIAQIGLRPKYGLPVAAVVTGCYWLGMPAVTVMPFILVMQGIVTACMIEVLRRAGRAADRVVAGQTSAYIDTAVRAGVRADELDQQRRLHDTVLATMTVVGTGAIPQPSQALRARAAADVAIVDRLLAGTSPEAEHPPVTARLDVALRAVSLVPRPGLPPLRTALEVPPIALPRHVVNGIGECVAEALTNVARHSGTTSAVVRAYQKDAGVVIEISDNGRGVDSHAVPLHRRGLHGSITGRMQALGGEASIVSGVGNGTRVILRWANG
ncbi:MAG: sensor histidine kinase [Pseudonocardiaceae bacterium]